MCILNTRLHRYLATSLLDEEGGSAASAIEDEAIKKLNRGKNVSWKNIATKEFMSTANFNYQN